MSMEIDQEDPPKPPPEDVVEAPLKEAGFQGSLHTFAVENACKLEQQNELASEDGLHKHRESLSQSNGLQKHAFPSTLSSPQKNITSGSSTSEEEAKVLRPTSPVPASVIWKRGLLVDANHQDAWEEAILLQDVLSTEEDAFVGVLRPNKGDEVRVRLRDLKVSKRWDESTGQWIMKGSCNLSKVMGVTTKEVLQSSTGDAEPLSDKNPLCEESFLRLESNKECTTSDSKYEVRSTIAGCSPEKVETTEMEDCLPPEPNCKLHGESVVFQSDIPINEEPVDDGAVQVGSKCLSHPSIIPDVCVSAVEGPHLLTSKGPHLCTNVESANEKVMSKSFGTEEATCMIESTEISEIKKEINRKTQDTTLSPSRISSPDIQHDHNDAHVSLHQNQNREQSQCYYFAYKYDVLQSSMESDMNAPSTSDSQSESGDIQSQISETPGTGALNAGYNSASSRPARRGRKPKSLMKGPLMLLDDNCGKESKSNEAQLYRDGRAHLRRGTTPYKRQLTLGNGRPEKKVKEKQELQSMGRRTQKKQSSILSESDDELSDSEDTLRSFRDRLVLKKQADAKKKIGVVTYRDLDMNKYDERSPLIATSMMAIAENGKDPSQTCFGRDGMLKNLAREIAKKALLEAGFTIQLRPRVNRDYNDSVYESPEGHTYWSVPRAWEAAKKEHTDKYKAYDGYVDPEDRDNPFSYLQKEGLARADKSTIQDVVLGCSKMGLLQYSLKRSGSFTGMRLHDFIKKPDLTYADLTDLLIEELGLLKRVQTKVRVRRKSSKTTSLNLVSTSPLSKTPKLISTDSSNRDGKKRKRGSESFFVDTHDRDIDHIFLESERSTPSSRVSSRLKQLDTTCLLKSEKGKKAPHMVKNTINAIIAKNSAKKGQSNVKDKIPRKGGKSKSSSSKQESSRKGEKGRARSGIRLEVRRVNASNQNDSSCDSIRSVLSWLIDRGAIVEEEKILCVDQKKKTLFKEGVVTREGILCKCCKKNYTVNSYEMHCRKHVKQPRWNLILASGKSLTDCHMEAWKNESRLSKTKNYVGVIPDDPNDDSCILCGDGGDLICCDRCPSTFHMACLGIHDIPEGNWYCPKCRCVKCGTSQKDEGDHAMVLCGQCERRFHVGCLGCDLVSIRKETFCQSSCAKIFCYLRRLIGIPHPVRDDGLSWSLLRCIDEDKSILSSDIKAPENHCKLAVALLVIKECFNAMVDPRTNVDMVTQALYNRWSEFDRLNYAGFYTAILEREGEIVCVATIRIHGSRLAEMPLIGTREKFRRQGMCRLLVGLIEKLLSSLQVAYFILPAIPELFDTWTKAFGFRPLSESLRSEIKDLSMMLFPGTELLQKSLLSPEKEEASIPVSEGLATADSDNEMSKSNDEGRSLRSPLRNNPFRRSHHVRKNNPFCVSKRGVTVDSMESPRLHTSLEDSFEVTEEPESNAEPVCEGLSSLGLGG